MNWNAAPPEERLKTASLAVGAWQSTESGIKILESEKPFDRDPFLYRLLMTGVAVAYARPFGNNYGIASLPDELGKFDNAELLEQHEELLLTRRKLYGHTDGNYLWNVESLPFGTQIRFRENPEGRTEVVPVLPTPDIGPASLPTIARLVQTQIYRVIDLMAAVVGGMIIPGKTYDIDQTYTVGKDFP